jgi:hypothetical protein
MKSFIKYLSELSWVGWLNMILIQWFFIRIAYHIDEEGGRKYDFFIIGLVIPLTGWWSDYIKLRLPWGEESRSKSEAINLVIKEREHQIEKGWSRVHDEQHHFGELSVRSAELAVEFTDERVSSNYHSSDAWGLVAKHKDNRVKSLTIAAALLIAELERELSREDSK